MEILYLLILTDYFMDFLHQSIRKTMSHTLDIQHFVFSTYCRRRTIPMNQREPLYRFIWKQLQARGCHLYRINGMSEHVHMVVDLHPSVSKSDLMKEIKAVTSGWMKQSGLYPDFERWGSGYFSESKDPSTLDRVVAYVKGQVDHHRVHTFEEELQMLSHSAGLKLDDRDLK